MRTLTKAIFGVAMLAGSALAIATPANAQSNFGFYFGNGVRAPTESEAVTKIAAAFGAGIRTCTGASGFPRVTSTVDVRGIITTGTMTTTITATGIADIAAAEPSIRSEIRHALEQLSERISDLKPH